MATPQESIGKAIEANIKNFRKYGSRNPMFTYYAAISPLKYREDLKSMMEHALTQSPRNEGLIDAIKQEFTQNEIAIGLCPIMSAEVRKGAQALDIEFAPISDQQEASAVINDNGEFDCEKLQEKIKQNALRVKIKGKLMTGTANATISYVRWMQSNGRYMQDSLIKELAEREANDLRHCIEASEEIERKQGVDAEERHVENDERFTETYLEVMQELELEELAAEQVAPTTEDDLCLDLGLSYNADERGIDLAFDAKSALIETERKVTLTCLQHEFNTGNISREELKTDIKNTERTYHQSRQKLARAYTVLRDPKARSAWEKKFGDPDNIPKGDPENSTLIPRSANPQRTQELTDRLEM